MLCEQVGSTWLQTNVVLDVADLSHELGRTDVAEKRAGEALGLARQVGDRQFTVYALGLLARFAAAGGRVERAGRLWGAIEAEEARGPIGQWEHEREDYAAPVLALAGPEFDAARAAGRALRLAEVVEYVLADRD